MTQEIFELSDPQKMQVEVRTIGDTRYPLLVVDNVYRHPEAVRDRALSLPYEPLGPSSPGGRAPCSSPRVVLDLGLVVEQHVGEAYGWRLPKPDAAFSPASRFHRMRCEGAATVPQVTMPHVDSVMLAAVVYLNLPNQCRGGTAFFRHRETGLAEWRVRTRWEVEPQTVRSVMNLGFDEAFRSGVRDGRWRDYDDLRGRIFDDESGSTNFMSSGGSSWDRIDQTEMRWNRLVCFPGFLFHTSLYDPTWFGGRPETDRVIQNLLLYWPRHDPP